jgi:hypothetical protein
MLYISQSHSRGTLSVSHDGSDLLTFRDTRTGRKRLFSLNGREAEAYTLCHRGATLETIAVESGLTLQRVKELAERWIKMKILVKIDSYYIATALRRRDELINNYLRERKGIMPI